MPCFIHPYICWLDSQAEIIVFAANCHVDNHHPNPHPNIAIAGGKTCFTCRRILNAFTDRYKRDLIVEKSSVKPSNLTFSNPMRPSFVIPCAIISFVHEKEHILSAQTWKQSSGRVPLGPYHTLMSCYFLPFP